VTAQEVLDNLVEELGYRDSRGFVDESVDPGVKGMVWSDLKEKCDVTAAFFKGAVPILAFVAADSREDAMRAHRRLWNYGRVPILIATTSDNVMALSCSTAQLPGKPDAALLAEASRSQELAAVFADFTRFSVESGRLARSRSMQLGTQERVDKLLLRNLRTVRSRLLAAGVYESEIEPLLGRSIFVRYLEDRRILQAADLRELEQPESLERALEQGWHAVASLFAAMSDHFNGDVFRRDVLTREIPNSALRVLSDFFHGADPDTGQVPLWQYDFAIIPPEFISSIYEQLLAPQQKSNAAYYTPRRVVDLVLDELMPSFAGSVAPTVLDPACGSGIFLTEAFRRLVYQRRAETRSTLGYTELSRLLVESIFGIDRSAEAIGVTAFGLYLALLEHVDPRTIWREVRLPDLVGKNLVVSDSFDTNPLSSRRFDIIVGNPPWQSALTPAASNYLRAQSRQAPDRQIATAFVWKSTEMLNAGGMIGFVLPSKTFLHNRSSLAARFRIDLFRSLDIKSVIDLSPLRKELFGATSPAAVFIFAADIESAFEKILHVSPRRTPISEIVDGIVIPQQNIQMISRSRAQVDPSIWKTLLWGGPKDLELVSNLRQMFETLDACAKSYGWKTGAGYQIVKNGDENDASHLHDLPYLPTDELLAMKHPGEHALAAPITDAVMHRPRERSIYLAPHVLMRKGFASAPMAAFVPFDSSFTDGLFALSGPEEDASVLRAVAAVLNSSVAQYWYLMTASSWGVEREQLHLREWLSLPLPPLDAGVVTALSEIVNQVADDDSWREQVDRVVEQEVYKLADHEQQLVAEALTVTLSELRDGPRSYAYDAPDRSTIEAYENALKQHMDDLGLGEWEVGLSETAHGFTRVTCAHLETSDARRLDSRFTVDDLLSSDEPVLNESLSSAAIVEPQAVVLDNEQVHIIKPNRHVNWLVSAADIDASDVFDALSRGEHTHARDGRA